MNRALSSVLLLALVGCGGTDIADPDVDPGTDADPVNSAPSVPGVAVTPDVAMYGEDLVCTIVTDSVDADGDAVTYRYAWTVDGADAGIDTDTVPGDQVGAWQTWACTVVATDGTDDSAPASSDVVTTDECVGLDLNGSQIAAPLYEHWSAMDLGFETAMTLEGWFRAERASTGGFLFYKGAASSVPTSMNLDYMVGYNPDGSLHFATGWSERGNDCDYWVLPEVMQWGEWMHIAATVDPETRTKAVFVNGELLGSCEGSYKNPAADGPLTIGGHIRMDRGRPIPSMQMRGNVDEVRVSKVVRYTADFTPAPWFEADEHTALLYHFNEGSGQTMSDASGHARDGQLFTNTWSTDESACEGYWDLAD